MQSVVAAITLCLDDKLRSWLIGEHLVAAATLSDQQELLFAASGFRSHWAPVSLCFWARGGRVDRQSLLIVFEVVAATACPDQRATQLALGRR